VSIRVGTQVIRVLVLSVVLESHGSTTGYGGMHLAHGEFVQVVLVELVDILAELANLIRNVVGELLLGAGAAFNAAGFRPESSLTP
jgi:hypothetical protein